MNCLEEKVLEMADKIEGKSIAIQAIESIARTVDNPTIDNILADLKLASALYSEFKDKIEGLNPSVANIFKALF